LTIFDPNGHIPKILIADDDPSVVRLIADRCISMGFNVETAMSGIEAVERLQSGGFDTMIIDIQMPGLDGLSVCADVVGTAARPLHVIVATGSRDAETVAKCDDLGALYLLKGSGFWANLESALIEIFPSEAPGIRKSGLRSTRALVPPRSRVLLVDEDLEMEGFIRGRLDKLGADTLYATDAAQGYRVACREEPSAIISEGLLPDGDAHGLLTRLRTTTATANTPFIVMSQHQLTDALEQSLMRPIGGRPGAEKILRKSKPVDVLELFATLRLFCGLRKNLRRNMN
jgi:CheY-like chemotaxis protein